MKTLKIVLIIGALIGAFSYIQHEQDKELALVNRTHEQRLEDNKAQHKKIIDKINKTNTALQHDNKTLVEDNSTLAQTIETQLQAPAEICIADTKQYYKDTTEMTPRTMAEEANFQLEQAQWDTPNLTAEQKKELKKQQQEFDRAITKRFGSSK